MKINANTTSVPDERCQSLAWSLKSSAVWQLMSEILETQIATRERLILSGKLTPEQYASLCGEAKGLKVALELPERLTVDNDIVAEGESA